MSATNPNETNSLLGSDHNNYLSATQQSLTGAANNDVIDTTYSAGSAPTPATTQTISNSATPTVVELLQYCANLEAQVAALQQVLIAHGLMADA